MYVYVFVKTLYRIFTLSAQYNDEKDPIMLLTLPFVFEDSFKCLAKKKWFTFTS